MSCLQVLSMSEVALLHRHTHSLLHCDKVAVATQTSRSGFSDAKQVAELQQQLTALEQTAASRDKRMAAKGETPDSVPTTRQSVDFLVPYKYFYCDEMQMNGKLGILAFNSCVLS